MRKVTICQVNDLENERKVYLGSGITAKFFDNTERKQATASRVQLAWAEKQKGIFVASRRRETFQLASRRESSFVFDSPPYN